MANSIKYNTGTEANALSIGNFHMGVGDVSKGPTSTTGFHNGINPPPGGYTIYIHNKNIGPSIQRAFNDAELIRITNTIASTSYTTINECFNYFDGQVDKMVVDQPINYVVTDELVLDLNAGIIPSYPKSGTSWKDLSGNGNNGTLINNPDFNSNETFTVNSGGTGSERIDIVKPSQLATFQYLTIEILFKLNTLPTANYGINTPILGARIGSDYMIFAYPQVDNKSHLGVSYDDSRFRTSHESVFETEVGRWVRFTHVGIPYEEGGYQRGKLMYYINGVLDRDEFISGDSNGWSLPNPFYVGYDARWNVYSDVDVAAIKMYNKQLTAEEISANYFQAPIITDGLIFAIDAGNLVSYENGSTTAYSLTGSVDGTLGGGTYYSPNNGGMFVFDGDNDYLQFATNPVFERGTTPFTMEAWVELLDNTGDANISAVTGGGNPLCDNCNGGYFIYFMGSTSRVLNLRFDDSGLGNMDSISYTRSTSFEDGKFHHIVGLRDGTNTKLYLDGELVQTGTDNAVDVNDIGTFFISGWSNYRGNMNVGISRIYDRALTAEEVMQNYSAGKGRFGA